jgi:tRNA pseudouridine38-40 synthase
MRYLITIAYDGSKYYGFQRQDGKITVQGELEKALTIINKEPVIIEECMLMAKKLILICP